MRLNGSKVVLREKRMADAPMDHRWRCDPEVAELDAVLPLNMSFERFAKLFEDQLRYPTPGSDHFAIETLDGKYIGNCMYYDLDSINKQAELGIVIGDREYWSHGYGYDSVTTLLEHMFTACGLGKVYLHTLEWNTRAKVCFTKCGFTPVRTVKRTGQMFIRMEIERQRWQQLRDENGSPQIGEAT